MPTPKSEWASIEKYACQNVRDDFASRVVQRAYQEQRTERRQRRTLFITYSFCLLCALSGLWLVKHDTGNSNQAQWECVYIENEILRTSL